MDLKEIALWYSDLSKTYGGFVKAVYGALLLLAGWLLKKGNEKYKSGIKAGRDAESAEKLKRRIEGHHWKIERLEDRVSKIEQSVCNCQEQRGELVKPVEKLISAKIEAMEKTIEERIRGQRALALEEKRREMIEVKAFIREELERLLG